MELARQDNLEKMQLKSPEDILQSNISASDKYKYFSKIITELPRADDRFQLITSALEYLQYSPGYSLQVFNGTDCYFDYTTGISDIRPEVPVTRDTFFDIASLTKVVMMAAYHSMKDEYNLPSLNINLGSISLDWAITPFKNIPLIDLIWHSSGIKLNTSFTKDSVTTQDSLMNIFSNLNNYKYTDFETLYSDTNILLFLKALELYSGISFNGVISDFIARYDLGFLTDPQQASPDTIAFGVRDDSQPGSPNIGQHFGDYKARAGVIGPAGVFATPNQMNRFIQGLFSDEYFNEKAIRNSYGPPAIRPVWHQLNLLQFRKSATIGSNNNKMYAYGHTGNVVICNPNSGTHAMFFQNHEIQQTVLERSDYKRNRELKLLIPALLQFVMDSVD